MDKKSRAKLEEGLIVYRNLAEESYGIAVRPAPTDMQFYHYGKAVGYFNAAIFIADLLGDNETAIQLTVRTHGLKQPA